MENIAQYWIESANQNYQTMNNLLKSKDYSWALFLGHLVLEKQLKAVYAKKTQSYPLYTHGLMRFQL